jgi:NAD(P)-dependent dehydrogenase (short-subunit alcohol dehydrogenase family)
MTTTIALITGANKGIGLETARQFGERGFTVLAGARDEERGLAAERELRADGVDARFVSLDVTADASVQEAADWIEREYGRLDILVNNAGIARGNPASETNLDTMREVYEVNVFGVIRVTNAMLPLLRRAPAARIVLRVSGPARSVLFRSIGDCASSSGPGCRLLAWIADLVCGAWATTPVERGMCATTPKRPRSARGAWVPRPP